ncbi:MAG: hypothetical protein WCI77_05400 [Candidatus Omnitrophota bacterium]
MKFFILFTSFLLCAAAVYAHPPSSVNISRKGTTIEVVVTHTVSNPSQHYIKLIEVFLNGKMIIEQHFCLQTANSQQAVYNIPELKNGDTVEVEADCNQFGELKQKIIIKE